VGGGFPSAEGDTADLEFNNGTARKVTIDVTNARVGTLLLGDTGSGTDSSWTIDAVDLGANKLTFDAIGTDSAILSSTGATNTITANIDLAANLAITAGAGLNIGNASTEGIIGGTGNISKAGAGALTLAGTSANTYVGTFSVSAGTVNLSKTAGQNSITGNLSISGGTVTQTTANQIADTATVEISGGTYQANQNETFNILNMTSGSMTLTQASTNTLNITTANLSGGTITSTTGNSKNLNFGTLNMSGGVITTDQFNNSGRTAVTVTGDLNITNTESGAYVPFNLQGATTNFSFLQLDGDLSFTGSANTNTVTLTWNKGSGVPQLVLSAGDRTFDIGDGAAQDDLTIKLRITNSGNLIKDGAGSLRLDGPSTFSGFTKVTQGTLVLGLDAVNTTLATGSSVTVNSTDDTLSRTNHGLVDGDVVILGGGVNVPGGTANAAAYYVINASANSFQLSLTRGGAFVDMSSNGSSVTITHAGALGSGNAAIVLGDTTLTGAGETISLISDGPFTHERAITVANAGASTTIGGSNVTGTTTVYAGNITLAKGVNLSAQNAGARTEFRGLIDDGAGSFSVTASGLGIVVLSNAAGNTYDGGTTVTSGTTLIVNNTTGSGTGGGAVQVNAGGTLGGSGIISGNVTIQGAHNPGNSAGIQTFGADLEYSGGTSTVQFELAANTDVQGSPTPVFDQIIVGNNLIFTASTSLTLSFTPATGTVDWSDAFWTSNHSWTVYDVAGTTSGFANLSLTITDWLDAQGDSFNATLPTATFSLSQNGQDVVLNYTAPVPEPGALVLGAVALVGMLSRRRRRG
jgi:autotransporter-associated beta strand protein